MAYHVNFFAPYEMDECVGLYDSMPAAIQGMKEYVEEGEGCWGDWEDYVEVEPSKVVDCCSCCEFVAQYCSNPKDRMWAMDFYVYKK